MPIPKIQPKAKSKVGLRKGPAKFTLNGRIATIAFLDAPNQPYSFDLDDPNANHENVSSYPEGAVFATVATDGSRLYSIRPLTGSFVVKFDRFFAPAGELPAPRHYESTFTADDGTTKLNTYEAFTALLRITAGPWAGAILPSFLRYGFVDAGDGVTTGLKSRGRHAERLAAFLEYAGLDLQSDTIPYSENVLPWLEKTLQERNHDFMVVVDNGYVEGYGPAPILS